MTVLSLHRLSFQERYQTEGRYTRIQSKSWYNVCHSPPLDVKFVRRMKPLMLEFKVDGASIKDCTLILHFLLSPGIFASPLHDFFLLASDSWMQWTPRRCFPTTHSYPWLTSDHNTTLCARRPSCCKSTPRA